MLQWLESCDRAFVKNEADYLIETARKVVNLIDAANTLEPYTVRECDDQRGMQDEAIGLCSNLIREMNYIADTIDCNKNFAVKMEKEIEREISLIRGWRKSCNPLREKAIAREIKMREKIEAEMTTEEE